MTIYIYDILKDCPLFRGLSAEKIEELLSDREFSVEDYPEGEMIASKDTAYSGLMIILEGEAVGEITDNNGRRIIVDTFSAPQLISPAFLFGGYNRLPFDVAARSNVSILTLHRGLLFELMQDNIIIMSNFIDIISNRANMLSRKIYYLSFKTVREKMVNYLLERTSESAPSLDTRDITPLVEYLNASAASIHSVFKDLARHGVIKYGDNIVTVLDRNALTKSKNN